MVLIKDMVEKDYERKGYVKGLRDTLKCFQKMRAYFFSYVAISAKNSTFVGFFVLELD